MSIDWLRLFVAVWSVLLLFSMIVSILTIGQERKPSTPATVGCTFMILIPVFVMLLLVWQRLG